MDGACFGFDGLGHSQGGAEDGWTAPGQLEPSVSARTDWHGWKCSLSGRWSSTTTISGTCALYASRRHDKFFADVLRRLDEIKAEYEKHVAREKSKSRHPDSVT